MGVELYANNSTQINKMNRWRFK